MAINYQNLKKIQTDLSNFSETSLMIVTKKQPQSEVIELINKGFNFFGENKVQEMHKKFFSLKKKYNFKIHLIGPLQSNKVKLSLSIADGIQSLDRVKLVDEILKHLNDQSVTKEFFIQINIGKEIQKSGILPDSAPSFYEYCLKKNLPISGLMCIPPNVIDPSDYFNEMIHLRDKLNKKLKLSMGMSNDYNYALNNQSNILRIGSLIFA